MLLLIISWMGIDLALMPLFIVGGVLMAAVSLLAILLPAIHQMGLERALAEAA